MRTAAQAKGWANKVRTLLAAGENDDAEDYVQDFAEEVVEAIDDAEDTTTRLFPAPGNSATVRSSAEAAVLSLMGLVEAWADRGIEAVQDEEEPGKNSWEGWYRAGIAFRDGSLEIADETYDPRNNAVDEAGRVTERIVTKATHTAEKAGKSMASGIPWAMGGALAAIAILFKSGAL